MDEYRTYKKMIKHCTALQCAYCCKIASIPDFNSHLPACLGNQGFMTAERNNGW